MRKHMQFVGVVNCCCCGLAFSSLLPEESVETGAGATFVALHRSSMSYLIVNDSIFKKDKSNEQKIRIFFLFFENNMVTTFRN